MIHNQPLYSPRTSDQRRWMRRFIILSSPVPWVAVPAITLGYLVWPAANGILIALELVFGLIIPICTVFLVGRLLAVDECDPFTFRWSLMSMVWLAFVGGGIVLSVFRN